MSAQQAGWVHDMKLRIITVGERIPSGLSVSFNRPSWSRKSYFLKIPVWFTKRETLYDISKDDFVCAYFRLVMLFSVEFFGNHGLSVGLCCAKERITKDE
jgi:hypothetical protein